MPDPPRTINEVSGQTIGAVVQAERVERIELSTGRARPVAVTGLPPAVPALVGRGAQLAQLDELLRHRESTEEPARGVAVVAGLAGVGKTALALAAAHGAWRDGWFPGGVLMIDMLGYDPPELRVSPEQALGSVLGNVGIAGKHIPADGPGRERLWRSVLAERAEAGDRMLIVIDNVSSAHQVRPLLPGVPLHRVLITSRHTLADVEAAVLVRLGVLSADESASLLCQQLDGAVAGDRRAVSRSVHAREIARMCGGLPLAIRIAGALLAADVGQPLSEMAGTLADERSRLEELSYDGSFAVRSAFDLSYRLLGETDARLFRLLAAHRGREFPAEIADVLLGEKSGPSLRRLHRANLIEAGSERGRWRMHDLVRLYAQELAAEEDDYTAVVEKLADHYLSLCRQAQHRLNAAVRTSLADEEVSDVLTKVDLELQNVAATVTQLHELGRDDQVTRLAESMFTYFDLRKCWDVWVHVDQVALKSALRRGDGEAASRIRISLGVALRDLGRFDEAIDLFGQVLAHFRSTGQQRREAEARNNLAVVLRKRGRLDSALRELDTALSIWERSGDALGQTRALNNLGLVHSTAGSHAVAVDCFERALELARTSGDERRRAKVLHNLGAVCLRLGWLEEATAHLRLALEIRRRLGDRHREAKSLAVLGTALLELDRPDEGTGMLRQALVVFRGLGDERWAGKVTTWLAGEG